MLLSQAALALPYENRGDFLGSINEFIYHATESLISGFLGWWDQWLYGEYNSLLEQDLSSVNPEQIQMDLPEGYLNTESREALTHLANSQEAARRAKDKQAECKRLKQEWDGCTLFCIPEYHVKLCAKEFFQELGTAQSELNQSLSKTLNQISTDYLAYKHYGIGTAHATKLDGCYLYSLDIYNALKRHEADKSASSVRGEERPGDTIVLAIASSSRDFQTFFNKMAANQKSLIPEMLEKHKACREIESKLLDEYREMAISFSKETERLEGSYAPIEAQKLCLLEAEDLEAIQPTQAKTLAQTIDFKRQEKLLGKDPKESCRLIEKSLKELKSTKTESLVDSTGDGYLAKALERIDSSEAAIRQTDENLAEMSNTLAGIKDRAMKRAQALKAEAGKLRPGLEPEALVQHKKDMEEAGQAIAQAEAKTTEGEAAKALAGAIMKLEAMLATYSEQPEEQVQEQIDEAEARIILAESDHIEASTEKAMLNSAKEALKRKHALLAKIHARNILASLEEKARETYPGLQEKRQKIRENLDYLPEQEQKNFLKYEKYYTPNLDYSAAIGRLLEMENAYAAALATEEKRIQDTSKELLESGIKARTRYAGPQIAGEPAQAIAEYSFTNPTGFTMPASQISLALDPRPIGAITAQNILGSSYLEESAYASDKLMLSTKALPEGASFSLTLSYYAIPATLLSLKKQAASDLSDAEFRYTAAYTMSGSPEKILLPIEENIPALLNKYPDDFQEIDGRHYLAAWYPSGSYERSFKIPTPVTMERRGIKTILKGQSAEISETIHLENHEGYNIDSLQFSIDTSTPATEVKGAEYSSGRLKIKTTIGPREQKDLSVSYTASDSRFYCLAYQQQAKQELEKEHLEAEYQLNAELESAAVECESGNIEEAIKAIASIGSSISSLREISRGNTQEKETYERLEKQAQDRLDQAEAANQAAALLGIQRTDTYPAMDALSKAKELYSRGNIKQATAEARRALAMPIEPAGIDKALEEKKMSLKQKMSGLAATKTVLEQLGLKDPELTSSIDQAGASQTRFELALISANKTKAIYALLEYQGAYDNASGRMSDNLERYQGQIDAQAGEMQENVTGLLQALSSANYSTPLGLHVPYSFEQWAKQQGMAGRDQEYEKAREKHIANLTAYLAKLESLKIKPPEEKLTLFQQAMSSFGTRQAQEFLSKAGSEVERKRNDAEKMLALAEEQASKGMLTSDAVKIVSDAKQYNSQGRYLDSIAYTGFAIATGTKPPDNTPRLAALSLVLLIAAGLLYTKKDKLRKYLDSKEEDMDIAERGLSFRKANEQ